MKKTLFILIAILGVFSVNYATATLDKENVMLEKTNVIAAEEMIIENIYCDNVCPDDDCYSGCLYTTYQTEYCVGVKCRNRTLYKCNMNSSHKYWIYHK